MTKEYFKNLNYSLGNEDTTLEVEMVKRIKPKSILAIAGCGSRAIPLVLDGVENLYCIDVSVQQLYITELRKEAVLKLDFLDYLKFWGFPPHDRGVGKSSRKDLFSKLDLSLECREYFEYLFDSLKWESILYEGKWEKTFILFSKLVPYFLGSDWRGLFEHRDTIAQEKYFREKFPVKRWRFLLTILGNRSMFNALLYKGDFIQKNVKGSHFDYYYAAFTNLMTKNLSRKSFFMSLCFHGGIFHQDANTVEAREDIFNENKQSLINGARVHYLNKDLVSCATLLQYEKVDFLSLSDVPSYFSGELEKNFLQDLKICMNPGAVVVLRYYLRVSNADESGFSDITDQFQDLIDSEMVQMYKIKVLKLD